MFPPGFEPGTFRVLGERDNHYTTETELALFSLACDFCGGAEEGLYLAHGDQSLHKLHGGIIVANGEGGVAASL